MTSKLTLSFSQMFQLGLCTSLDISRALRTIVSNSDNEDSLHNSSCINELIITIGNLCLGRKKIGMYVETLFSRFLKVEYWLPSFSFARRVDCFGLVVNSPQLPIAYKITTTISYRFLATPAHGVASICYKTKNIPKMDCCIHSSSEITFSDEAIREQLERVFVDPLFAESGILKRFLTHIVTETLQGRSNCLKEYTIALKVLEKSTGFKPQENGIVRIHAGRLRRALDSYYNGRGKNDEIIISIPKGKYIPEFASLNQRQKVETCGAKNGRDGETVMNQITLAVLPFVHTGSNELVKSFTNALCLQMSSALMCINGISVIAYQAVRVMSEKIPDIRELSIEMGCNFFIAGGVQFFKDQLCVNVQLIKTKSCQQVWSDLYERKLMKSNFFEIQDEISRLIVMHMEEAEKDTIPEDNRLTPMRAIV